MRLDKFLNDYTNAGRSTLKKEIKNGFVFVNGSCIKNPEYQVSETDLIQYKGDTIKRSEYYYFLLNKPAGVVSATQDHHDKTVIDLFSLPEGIKKSLFPVGRLDKDTEGLLLLTNDGALAHELLSPKKHVDKTYYCKLKHSINEQAIRLLEEGVDIGEKVDTLPAKVKRGSDDKEIYLTIQEGKFHQVKRMMLAVGNEIVYLKRISMGALTLDDDLETGTYRELNEHEIAALQNRRNGD